MLFLIIYILLPWNSQWFYWFRHYHNSSDGGKWNCSNITAEEINKDDDDFIDVDIIIIVLMVAIETVQILPVKKKDDVLCSVLGANL